MEEARTVEDRLRAEYFELLPAMRRTLTALETEVRRLLLPSILELDPFERLSVVSRLKDCASAVDSLRREQQLGGFDQKRPDQYSLLTLPDLVGIRILAFPPRRIEQAHAALHGALLSGWTAKPILSADPAGAPIALKYYGRYAAAGTSVTAEIQIVSSLVGSFWDVEHAALYKPTPDLHGILRSPSMKGLYEAVLLALREFEGGFERHVREHRDRKRVEP